MEARGVILKTYIRHTDVIPLILEYLWETCGLKEDCKCPLRPVSTVRRGPYCHHCKLLYHFECYKFHTDRVLLPDRSTRSLWYGKKYTYRYLRSCKRLGHFWCYDCGKNTDCRCAHVRIEWEELRRDAQFGYLDSHCPKCCTLRESCQC